MKVSEMLVALENILVKEGDLEVTIYDEYTASEGWDYKSEDLWIAADCDLDWVQNDEGQEIKKVVLIH